MNFHSRYPFVVYCRDVTLDILKGDTRQLCAALALVSLCAALTLWTADSTTNWPGFATMSRWFGKNVIGDFFASHYLMVLWRVYEPHERLGWARTTHGLGFALFAAVGVTVWYELGHLTVPLISELCWAPVSLWALSRVGNGIERTPA